MSHTQRLHATPRLLAAALLCVGLTACSLLNKSTPDYVVLLPDAQGVVGKIVVKGAQGQQLVDRAGMGVALDGASPPRPVTQEAVVRDFGDALKARPEFPLQYVLYFETGGSVLTQESQRQIRTILETTLKRVAPDVSVVGHTDTVGRADANARLAQQRAQAIADLLRSQGLEANSLRVESHGEANLLVLTPDETPEPRNRRVEVTVR